MISIIIPAYNAAKTLKRCVDSILTQTYNDIEVIIVDDGSKDGTLSIARNYEKVNDNVRVIEHGLNKGLFAARITGVKYALGQFIGFVDSDDYISVDYYRLLVNQSETTGADIVIGDFYLTYLDKGKLSYFNNDPIRNQKLNICDAMVMDTFMEQEGAFYGWQLVWNKLYSVDLWKECLADFEAFAQEYPDLNMTEDIAFSAGLWCHAKRVVNVSNAVYYYCQSKAQMTADAKRPLSLSVKKSNLEDVVAVFEFFKKCLEKSGIYEKYQQYYMTWKQRYGLIYMEKFGEDSGQADYIRNEFFLDEDVLDSDASSNYFYELSTEVAEGWSKLESIKQAMSSSETRVVSFDVFDTCLLRPFWKPTDVFAFMNSYFVETTGAKSAIDYASIRVESEKAARLIHKDKEDIALDDIFETMESKYCIADDICQRLKSKEQELEIRFSQPRAIAKELYDLAVYCGKQIVFTSDMYMPVSTIEAMLKKNGFDKYDRIFVSNNEGVAKYTGNLYHRLIEILQVQPDSIVHIGDNRKSDYNVPRTLGIRAFHIKSVKDCFEGSSYWSKNLAATVTNRDLRFSFENYLGYRTLMALAINRIYDNPFLAVNEDSDFDASPMIIGYFVLGLYLYAVTDWLCQQVQLRDKRANKVHFAARDGYLVQLAYDSFAKIRSLPPSNYLYVSRKALVLSNINSKIDLLSLIDNFNIFKSSPQKFLKLFGQSLDNFDLPMSNFQGYFTSRSEYDDFVKWFADECYDKVNFDEAQALSKEYLQENISTGDVLFDIGYSGRVECVMNNLLGYSIDSYYIHTNSDIISRRQKIAGFTTKTLYGYKPNITGVIREYVFMKNAPSTIGYIRNKEGRAVPEFEEYNVNYSAKFSCELIQNYALQYVRKVLDTFGEDIDKLYYHFEDATEPFEYFLHHGQYFDRSIFSSLIFEDDFGLGKQVNAVDFWTKDMERANVLSNSSFTAACRNEAYDTYLSENIISMSIFHKAGFWLKNDKMFFVKRTIQYLTGQKYNYLKE